MDQGMQPLSGVKFAVALLALLALAACGQNTLLTVHASATTRTAPDLAIVTLGVSARGDTARAAQQAQNTRMETVLAAARAAGVEEQDVQTVGFSLEPQYAYPRNAAPRITGYVSRNIVSLRLRNLNAVSGLIDATVAEGANELQGIQFTFQNEEASRNAARAEALQTARARADTYAEVANMRVVRMLAITEPGGVAPPLDAFRRGLLSAPVAVEQSADGAQIRPGELEAQSAVSVVFELR
ncbi:SIMPL domain-containing protein [Terricaulis silvestris]|uniref:26 kDa periplasmic immunogenic protein n=1 Tax=Terricaulis silvestris TaxID=2686094 RepID=A0A6I6MSJ4_9CAUL|nr:SIMPL domain-containing protein [Terricaulis silvestris]QGZ96396.1 26 kDa periplasmic immunogenic protein precursor [Terricaulis silvestris]